VLACAAANDTNLLELQRLPQRFGGDEGPLGRYYMGHLTGKIATVVLRDPTDVARFDYELDQNNYWIRRRFSISPATQIEQQLLNTVSGWKSAVSRSESRQRRCLLPVPRYEAACCRTEYSSK